MGPTPVARDAYHTFLGALCFQMLQAEMPMREEAIAAVETLKGADGGYAELNASRESQTSATAAALSFLIMQEALPLEDMAAPARFLAAMQSADGGLQAHAAVPRGDLLSTYTGLLTLWVLADFRRSTPPAWPVSCDAWRTPAAVSSPATAMTRRTLSTPITAWARWRCCGC